MFTKLSEDIKALLNFELERGNEVFNFGAGDGYNFIELRLPFHTSDMGFKDVLVDTIHPWEGEVNITTINMMASGRAYSLMTPSLFADEKR